MVAGVVGQACNKAAGLQKSSEIVPDWVPKWHQHGSQNGSKMAPKWLQNGFLEVSGRLYYMSCSCVVESKIQREPTCRIDITTDVDMQPLEEQITSSA